MLYEIITVTGSTYHIDTTNKKIKRVKDKKEHVSSFPRNIWIDYYNADISLHKRMSVLITGLTTEDKFYTLYTSAIQEINELDPN